LVITDHHAEAAAGGPRSRGCGAHPAALTPIMREPTEKDFDNPVFEQEPPVRAPTFEAEAADSRPPTLGAQPKPSSLTNLLLVEPESPRSPETDEEQTPRSAWAAVGGAAAFDDEDRDKNLKRGTCLYMFLQFGILVMMPAYALIALFVLYVLYLVPNAMSLVVASVAVSIPVVLYVGHRSSKDSDQVRLRFFSFLMILVLTMQLSLAVVIIVDDDTLFNAFMLECGAAARQMCTNVNDLPFGVSTFAAVDQVCDCVADSLLSAASGSGGASGPAGGVEPEGKGHMVSCLADQLTERFGKTQMLLVLFGTVVLEITTAKAAWVLMVDLDVKALRKAARQPGGAPVGTLRGTIVCGTGLRSVQANEEHYRQKSQKKKKGKRRKKAKKSKRSQQQAALEQSNLYAVLSISSPDLAPKNPDKEQKTQTLSIEDDNCPSWNHGFGMADHTHILEDQGYEQTIDEVGEVHTIEEDPCFNVYESSKELVVKVFDTPPNKKKKSELVGTARARLHGEYLPDYSYTMDGVEPVDLPLQWTDKDLEDFAAGTVAVNLIYVQEPDLLGRTAEDISKSWYFEVTVLATVALATFVLAVQAPAAPPPTISLGAIRVLEIFLAVNLSVELVMESTVHAHNHDVHWRKDPWFILATLVLICMWLAILTPSLKFVDVIDDTVRSGVDEVFGSSTSSSLNNTLIYRDIDGSVTDVASDLIAKATLIGAHETGMAVPLKKFVSFFRVFRLARPVRTLRMLKQVDIIISVVRDSLPVFGAVGMLVMFLLGVLSLVGTTSFAGALQWECIGKPNDVNPPACSFEQTYYAHQLDMSCPVRCPHTLVCASGDNPHLWCAPLQDGIREIGGDSFGYRDYDNFWRAMVAIFVQTTKDGGMHTMPMALSDGGVNSPAMAWGMSFVTSLLMNLLALNLFLAVCCSAYSDSSTKYEDLAKAHEQAKIASGTQPETLNSTEENKKPYVQKLEETQWNVETSESCMPTLRELCRKVCLNMWFDRLTSTFILANTACMAAIYEGIDDETLGVLKLLEGIFLFLFMIEASVRWLGAGHSLYFSSSANRFDVFVIVGSLAGFIAAYYTAEVQEYMGLNPQTVQSLRSLRLLRALQIARFLARQKSLMVILKTIFSVWKPLLIHSIFCLFSMCMWSIISMHLLGGSLGPDATLEDYDAELDANFETFGRGLLTVFE
jgi:hypothetical protein